MINTINHFESIKNVLAVNKIFPIRDFWTKYEITHYNEKPNKDEKKKIINEMKNTFGNKSGLYAYYQNRELLYIGKGNPLISRIRSHFNEAYNTSKPDDLWFSFFKLYSGSLELYWIEIDAEAFKKEYEAVRITYESILNVLDEPKFESYKRDRNKKRN